MDLWMEINLSNVIIQFSTPYKEAEEERLIHEKRLKYIPQNKSIKVSYPVAHLFGLTICSGIS